MAFASRREEGRETRACRRLNCYRHGPDEYFRDVLGPHGLIRPLHFGTREHRGFDIGEPGLHQKHLAGLLVSRHNQRRLIL